MNYAFLSCFILEVILFFSFNSTYACSFIEQEVPGTSRPLEKRKRVVFEADNTSNANKENEINKTPTKKPSLSKEEHKSSASPPKTIPLMALDKKIDELSNEIERAYTNASKMDLYKSYLAFKALDYKEQSWAALGEKLAIERWPSQESWKETVGGFIFFPASRIHQYQETSYTEHLIQRTDILHGCIFAATFRHSLGLFYTTHILWTINYREDGLKEDFEQKRENFYTRTMRQAFCELRECLDRADVCYALGQAINAPRSLIYARLSTESQNYYQQGKDLKNQYEVLIARMLREEEEESMSDDFMRLAREGYFPAYLQASSCAAHEGKNDKAHFILEEAIARGYDIALLKLAYLYKNKGDFSKYHHYLEQAIQKDSSSAMIEKGHALLEQSNSDIDIEKLKKISSENIKQASDLFLKAGQLHDPQGYEHFSELKMALSHIALVPFEASALKREALDAIKQGCALGWKPCFWNLEIFFSEEVEKTVKSCGTPPYRFTKSLELFLKDNIGKNLPH